MNEVRQQVAVVGGGVAGLSAALLISDAHDVTLFEKNDYLGGHTNTIRAPNGPDKGLPIDTGFIVLNDRTYPVFEKFLARLKVDTRDADMSFGFHSEISGLQYAGTGLRGLFADFTNLFNLPYLRMLREVQNFNRVALADLETGELGNTPLKEYLQSKGASDFLVKNYLVPMGAAIWSSPDAQMLEFPAKTFLRFFAQHGLLTLHDRPQWKTVVGGSFRYVRAFQQQFPGRYVLSNPVKRISRREDGVSIHTQNEQSFEFDAVVIACHADQALALLEDPSPKESSLLGAWKYQLNHTILHTDESVLPPNKRAWASWNYTREAIQNSAEAGDPSRGDGPVSITYHMNRLQGIRSRLQYCVTLNRVKPIREERVIRRIDYTHPIYSPESVATQEALTELSGNRHTYYCGSYFGYGFHEDAVKSGVAVARHFGIYL